MGSEEPLATEARPNLGELPQGLRKEYIGLIKGVKPLSGEADASKKRDLTQINQSVLYLLRNVEAIGINGEDRVIETSLEELEKVPLMLRVGKEIGFRPESISISVDAQNRKVPEGALENFASSRLVMFIKANKSYRGDGVFMVVKRDDGKFLVMRGDSNNKEGHRVFDNLSELPLPPNLYIIEDHIDTAPAISPADSDVDWEIRHLPPFPSDYDYAKVSSSVSQFLNNISKGGERRNAKVTIMDVLTRGGTKNLSEIDAQAIKFLSQSRQLSQKVKELTDGIQVKTAKKIIKPGDLKNPNSYEQVMQRCFSGTFLTVDITGVWDRLDRYGKLQPMIIEAQTSAGLPGEPIFTMTDKELLLPHIPFNLAYLVYEQCLNEMNEKLFEIQLALK